MTFIRTNKAHGAGLHQNERGFILVTTVMFVLILSILGASLLSNGPLENSLITGAENGTKAFYLAEAGVARAMAVVKSPTLPPLSSVNVLRPASLALTDVPLIRAVQRDKNGNSADSTSILDYTSNGDGGSVTVFATGKAMGANGFATEFRTVQVKYKKVSTALPDYTNLITTTTGNIGMKKNETLTGHFRVPTAADSIALVGQGINKDSISVGSITPPDLTAFITRMKNQPGGYSTLTSAALQASSDAVPLVMGQSNNGIYYAGSGISLPGGQSAAIKLYGTVFILVDGSFSMSKDFNIQAGNASAGLVLVSNVISGTGLDFSKLGNNNSVPVAMITNGNINFKKASDLTNVSMFGADYDMDKDQTWSYSHAVMDPFINSLIAQGYIPGGSQGLGYLVKLAGQWSQVTPPRTQ